MGSRWLAVGATALVLAVGACGGSSESGTKVEAEKPIDAVLASNSRMMEEKTSKVAMHMRLDIDGESVEFTGDGAFDYSTGAGSMVLDMPEIDGVDIGTMEIVMLDNVMYQKFPPEMAAGLGGKQWVKIDMSEVTGLDFSQMAQAQQSNPAQFTSMTAGAQSVDEVGKEDVRGTSTTHYKVVVSFQKALAETEDPQLKKVIENAAKSYKSDTMPVELWLDHGGLPRRMKMVMDLSAMEIPGQERMGGTMDITMDLFDFGTVVDVQAPPPDQVTDMTDMAKQMSEGE